MKKQLLLTRMLLLVALLVGSVSVWGEKVTIASFNATDYYGGTTGGWSVTNSDYATSKAGNYYKLIASNAKITTPSINWSSYSNITITITARTYGGPNATQKKISVTQNSTELTSYSPSSTDPVASSALSITPTGTGSLIIACLSASSSKGSGVYEILIEGALSSSVATPTFSPVEGAVASGTDVTINCSTPNSTIYYELTTNGGEPSTPTTESTQYTSAINITTATKIKAIAIDNNGTLSNSEIASASYTIAEPCETPTFSEAAGEVDKGTTVTISSETSGSTIYYTKNGDEPTTSSDHGAAGAASATVSVDANMTIKAIAVKDGNANSEVASVTYIVRDYATLPFEWAGGTSTTFNALSGVKTNGLGSDYAAANAPYRIKFDTTGDYIQIKTNAQPGRVTIGVKIFGSDNNDSKITVQESADGEVFYALEDLSIHGDNNATVTIGTTNNFKATTRYIKLRFTRVVNVGVGPITITDCVPVTIGSHGWTSLISDKILDFEGIEGLTAYRAKLSDTTVTLNDVTEVDANKGIVLKGAVSTTYNVPVLASTEADIDTDLTGSATAAYDKVVGKYYYVLANKGGVEGFYEYTGDAAIPAGKAFFETSSQIAEGKFSIVFADDETDGIKAVSTKVENGVRYNLAGQKVGADYKGIVIVNGKKVIIK